MGNASFTFVLGSTVLTGLAVLIDAAALEELCLAVLTGTCPDFVTTAVGTKFLLGFLGLNTLSFYYSIIKDKDEGKSHAGTLIDIPVFVRSFSIITGFTIIDGDDITKYVVLGMKFCKKYASCQRIMKKFALEDKCERIMEDE
ncbi:hypothetical protein Tco_0937983 [Tanacetum coccineum]|uniref:Uncharacterized protein n=1 Tax=Tanacetum coccineum TaxID=301880 RepID=A0ABQ5DHS5_9ASTR